MPFGVLAKIIGPWLKLSVGEMFASKRLIRFDLIQPASSIATPFISRPRRAAILPPLKLTNAIEPPVEKRKPSPCGLGPMINSANQCFTHDRGSATCSSDGPQYAQWPPFLTPRSQRTQNLVRKSLLPERLPVLSIKSRLPSVIASSNSAKHCFCHSNIGLRLICRSIALGMIDFGLFGFAVRRHRHHSIRFAPSLAPQVSLKYPLCLSIQKLIERLVPVLPIADPHAAIRHYSHVEKLVPSRHCRLSHPIILDRQGLHPAARDESRYRCSSPVLSPPGRSSLSHVGRSF